VALSVTTDERVAIVTAASKGMGAACARELADRGYRVAVMARSESVMDVAAALSEVGVVGSVTVPDDLQRLVQAALDAYGRIDGVVNNTGHPAKGALLDISDADWRDGPIDGSRWRPHRVTLASYATRN